VPAHAVLLLLLPPAQTALMHVQQCLQLQPQDRQQQQRRQ
jgi:hypothetical protein